MFKIAGDKSWRDMRPDAERRRATPGGYCSSSAMLHRDKIKFNYGFKFSQNCAQRRWLYRTAARGARVAGGAAGGNVVANHKGVATAPPRRPLPAPSAACPLACSPLLARWQGCWRLPCGGEDISVHSLRLPQGGQSSGAAVRERPGGGGEVSSRAEAGPSNAAPAPRRVFRCTLKQSHRGGVIVSSSSVS